MGGFRPSFWCRHTGSVHGSQGVQRVASSALDETKRGCRDLGACEMRCSRRDQC